MKRLMALSSISLLGLSLTLNACSNDDDELGSGAGGSDGASASDGTDGSNGDDGADGADGVDGRDLTAGQIALSLIGRYASDDNLFDESAAEIVSYDPSTERLFVINAQAGVVDVLDLSDPTSPVKEASIDTAEDWDEAGGVNSVAVAGGVVAVAVENDSSTDPGRVHFYDSDSLELLGFAPVGALPDCVVFTPDGETALVANEGEPNGDYTIDPEGSVTIVDVSDPSAPVATTVGFTDFNAGGDREDELPDGVRIFGQFGHTALTVVDFPDGAEGLTIEVGDVTGIAAGSWLTLQAPGDPLPYRVASVDAVTNVITLETEIDGDSEVDTAAPGDHVVHLHDGASSVAQDLEPEYIAVSPDGKKAWVTLQENNAVAIIDIAGASVDAIAALGVKDHSIPGNELDVSDRDDLVNIQTWPIFGMYMPDTITSFEVGGRTYYATANEGDAREYDAYVEELRMKDIPKDSAITDRDWFGLDGDGALYENENLGRIATTLTNDTDGDGDIDQLHVFGARSFSIWDDSGKLVSDSGNQIEVITAQLLGFDFNNNNDENEGDTRSDAKGAEPEAIEVATIAGRTYAFVGLERTGGIMVFDVSNPASPDYVQYVNNRNFADPIVEDPAHTSGDLGPESIVVVPAVDSPTGEALVIVGNEISGTVAIYEAAVPVLD